jgi:hypothetical protein
LVSTRAAVHEPTVVPLPVAVIVMLPPPTRTAEALDRSISPVPNCAGPPG